MLRVKPEDVAKLTFRQYRKVEKTYAVKMDRDFCVWTGEGLSYGLAGDYLCRGEKGELWPSKAEIFERTHRPATDVGEEDGAGCEGSR